MGKNVFLMVLVGAIFALVFALLLPSPPAQPAKNLPWQIELLDDGSTKVFGLTLGKSTLREAEQVFREEAVISMFAIDEGARVVESFFKKVTLSGLKAKIVVSLDYSQSELEGVFDRGARIATMGSGQRKITLSTEDVRDAMDRPIVTITYLPGANLDSKLVEKRFGEPARKISEKKSDMVHWLYPEKGLDIILSDEEKDVLQYTLPDRFNQLIEPLLEQNEK